LLHDGISLLKDPFRLAAAELVRCHMSDCRVQMFGVVPSDKVCHPFPGVIKIRKAHRIVDPILQRFEERFDKRVIIAHPRPAMRYLDIQLPQERHQRDAFHRMAIIGMQGA